MNKKLERLLNPSAGLYFAVLAVFGIAAALLGQFVLAGVELGIAVLLFVLYLLFRRNRSRELQAFIQKATDEMNTVGGADSPFPMVVLRLGDGGIVHANEAFIRLTDFHDTMSERNIDMFLPGFDTDWLASGKTEYPYDVSIGKRRYHVYGTMIHAVDPAAIALGVLYFTDLTELYQVRDEYIRSRPVVSLILVDNYEELTRNMSEAAISGLNARINNTIMKWAQDYHGLLRRLEKNRFLLIFEKRDLKQAMDSKFAILEDIHDITAPSGLSATISIGLGVDGATFEEGYEYAALSIEMALSRGGDQAVVKDRLNFNFYGGRTKETDRRSKVRSRVTANTMMELIGQSSQVFIMGHKGADLDAVGAAMGIACLCRKKNKPAHIVLDQENNAAQKLLEEILREPEYKNVFITGEDALLQCDNRSTLVVVDTNRPDQVEFRPLLEAIPRVCVVDHHRRAADYIKPVVVNFHEPYASSAAEMVTELLQYAVERTDVLPIEAKSLMAGIFLDTKSFNVRTGERTFEAAAYLRQLGADTVEVKKLLQNDFQNTIAKHQIIKAARMYRHEIAIAALNSATSRALAAQAADELLNISGISASFVLYPDGDRVIVSARSIGDANVQVILEPLGGGGNSATAGAQVLNSSVKEVLDALVASIDKYYES
ncbi:MAG: DHH family phosphoesterase [Oscillospiraceae bacterium]|nr:DHH family phosphoesterase [Oscillospiraceae bacterium]